MPSVESYEALAPFTLEELVTASNSILREEAGRDVQARTVRYYITRGLLASPVGGPKYARYSIEHLRRIVAIRQWVQKGASLEDCAERLARGDHGGERWIGNPEGVLQDSIPEFTQVRSGDSVLSFKEKVLRQPRRREIVLTPFSTLLIDPRADVDAEIEYLKQALERLPRNFFDGS